jgi:MFS family permease
MKIDTSAEYVGPKRLGLWLEPGISKANGWVLMYAAYVTIGLLTFVNNGQAFVMSAVLNLPADQQGTVAGNLAFVTEMVTIALIAPFGILSDRIGRRPVYAFGMIAMGIAYFLYPLAQSIENLTVYRLVYAVGTAAATGMIGTIINDYPQEPARGKMVAVTGIFNALGVITVALVLGRLPAVLERNGFDTFHAIEYAHWVVAGICIISAVIIATGLKKGTPVKHEEKLAIKDLVLSGLRNAKNMRIALAYSSAFVARGDLVIVGVFITLWGSVAGIADGMTPAQAGGRAAILFATVQTSATLWAPFMGIILDRFNRVFALTFAMFLASAGYLCMGLIDHPLDNANLPFFMLLGVGQISAFFASQALIGQEAPRAERGSVIGFFGFCGALGILLATGVGGRLFDEWMQSGPFVFVGAMNLCVFLFGLIVCKIAPGPKALSKAERKAALEA